MPIRKASAEWNGDLKSGRGRMRLGSGAIEADFSFATRMGDQPGTNPEELIGAAHAGCFSMALAAALAGAGHTPEQVRTTAVVHLDKVEDGFAITQIRLQTEGRVPGIDQATFLDLAEKAKATCPVSKALAGAEIELEATLAG
jgi:osmotically inducible protein OsmC